PLPRCVRLGERPRRRAVDDAADPVRRAARGADEPAPGGSARHRARGDRVTEALLELRNVSLAFGGLAVLQKLDLHVGGGEIVSVIGPNGAGKTTLFNVVTGVYRPDDGEIVFEGREIAGLKPHAINR